MFSRILLSAALAGCLAALALTAAQAVWVTPLILQAESHEAASPPDDADHDHDDAWQPENGWQRTTATAASNSVMGIGFALMLCGMYALRQPVTVIQGLGWGLGGYFVFFAAPASGLPPELPGTATAALAARQYWWLGTAVATASGLALVFLQSRNALRAAGALVLAIPHVVGAPHPAVYGAAAPEALQASFRIASLLVNALFWVLLGTLSAAAFRRFAAPGEQHG